MHVRKIDELRLEAAMKKWGTVRDLDGIIAITHFGFKWSRWDASRRKFLLPPDHTLAGMNPGPEALEDLPLAQSSGPAGVSWADLVPHYCTWNGMGGILDMMEGTGWTYHLESNSMTTPSWKYVEFGHSKLLGLWTGIIAPTLPVAVAYASLEAVELLKRDGIIAYP